MTTFDVIRDIFHSGGHAFTGELEPINEIAFLVEHSYLMLRTIEIASKEEYNELNAEISSKCNSHDKAAGGGYAHVALKLIGERYLNGSRKKQVHFEQPFCGYFPDVVTDDKTIVVECGHTQNAGKMLDYFRLSDIKECIQIPYPDLNDNTIAGYSFVPGENLHEFLGFLEEQRRDDVKRIVARRKSPE